MKIRKVAGQVKYNNNNKLPGQETEPWLEKKIFVC